jgi:hypothetical protein
MSLQVSEPMTIYRDPAYYCGPGPAVVVDDHGRITVAFRRVPSWVEYGMSSHWHPATELCLTHSVDAGATWSSPQVFLGGYQCPNLRRLRDGALIHHTHRFELVTQALLDEVATGSSSERNWPGLQDGTPLWRSEDGGLTWGDPVYLSGVPGVAPLHPRLHTPVAVRGNVLQLGSGRLLVSAYTIGDDNTSHVFASDDDGRSWSWLAAIASDANETYLYETEAGDVVAFVRRHRVADRLWACRSSDGGLHWSAPEPVCRGYPACAVRLPSGRVLLAYGFRFAEGPGTRARLLTAECGPLATESGELVLREDGAVHDLGYPDAAVMPDGRAIVVYYHNRSAESEAGSDTPRPPRYIEACLVEET